jgi:hypothetical protein
LRIPFGVRQLLIESMVLAATGTIAGLLFAGAAVRLLLVLGHTFSWTARRRPSRGR